VVTQAAQGVVGRSGGRLWGAVAVLRCCLPVTASPP